MKKKKRIIIGLLILLLTTLLTYSIISLINIDGSDKDYCESKEDCVPASCCHPISVVNKNYAPDCERIVCTMSCEGPLDCGAGEIYCQNNKCVIVSN